MEKGNKTMMEDYQKAKTQLMKEKDKLTERLLKVLVKNGIKSYSAWFHWGKTNTIVWNNCNIPRQAIIDLEEEFGEIQCIYTYKGNRNTLFVKFKGV